jgi:cytochrome c oxidase assembly factor CtaG
MLAGLAATYGRGVHELWHRRGVGAVVPIWRAVAFGAGLAALALGQSPAVHEAAERSFAGHMAQHMVFLVVAGPLLAAGAAGLPLAVAAPASVRRRAGRLRVGPLAGWARRPARRAIVAGALQTVVLWGWHLPGPALAAAHGALAHAAEHACFVAASWLLWSCLLAPGRHRLPGPAGLLLIFAAGMPAAALGVVLTLAPVPLYPPAVLTPAGSEPLAAQQLAGLVMWAPMEATVLVLAAAVLLRWLAGLNRRLPAAGELPAADPVRAPAGEVLRR